MHFLFNCLFCDGNIGAVEAFSVRVIFDDSNFAAQRVRKL